MFPERAELIRTNPKLIGYRVFLGIWNDFISFLKQSYERVYSRRASYTLVVYGPQGVGKTLLADKLKSDFYITKDYVQKEQRFSLDHNNLWHQLSCGHSVNETSLIKEATLRTEIIDMDGKIDWVKEIGNIDKEKIKIVILDNAERAYFGASLARMDESTYVSHKNDKAITEHIAQQFIRLARSELASTLFIVLGNDRNFLSNFSNACEMQHGGMVKFHDLPLPSPTDKEKICRINVNRLNPVSYWYCIDKSGPENKRELFNRLKGTANFPDTFSAVDDAFAAQGRYGRPANKCLLTLLIITPNGDTADVIANKLAGTQIKPFFEHNISKLYVITSNFCQIVLGETDQTKMLESEFTLRLLFLYDNWTKHLMGNPKAQNQAIECINALLEHPKTGQNIFTQNIIIGTWKRKCDSIMSSNDGVDDSSLQDFWAAGAVRSIKYESVLKKYFPGYNTCFLTGYSKRPDILIKEYVPCAILSAPNDQPSEINTAIRRNCHAVEITAQKNPTPESVVNYLGTKLNNYIDLIKEL